MNRPMNNRPMPSTPRTSSPAHHGAAKRRFRVVAPIKREGQEKPFWSRVGMAFENEPKEGKAATISIKLDSLPLGGELVLFEDDGSDAAATE